MTRHGRWLETGVAIWLVGIVAAVGGGCGPVTHAAEFEPTFVPRADTLVELGPVTNETGKTFDIDLSKMLSDALREELKSDQLLWTEQAQGDRLVMTSKILEYEEGDAFKRTLIAGWGSTVLSVHCELKDGAGGKLVGAVNARRTVSIGGAFTVGAWKTVFASIAGDLVNELLSEITKERAGFP